MKQAEASYVWKDRKRIIFGLPWSFTRYMLTDEKLIIDQGFLSRSEDEIRLYRITDITLKRAFWERIFGLGTIHCCSGDKTSPEFDILHIKDSRRVKDMLSDMVEHKRLERRIGVRELLDDAESEEEFGDEHE
ncbi:MAG: PH domain-containing protein [Clostridia bacterium]|nr:PH domain-containing protein [Clostridia bacterium]